MCSTLLPHGECIATNPKVAVGVLADPLHGFSLTCLRRVAALSRLARKHKTPRYSWNLKGRNNDKYAR
jgi:hypothetical protein